MDLADGVLDWALVVMAWVILECVVTFSKMKPKKIPSLAVVLADGAVVLADGAVVLADRVFVDFGTKKN